ncbi:hypothetical protein ACTACL_11395 [Pseudomonas syringae]|uniref:hypothetical protein n=1 Tax=Pseudomonas syringae TaxID=317 RepID=UPI003F798335
MSTGLAIYGVEEVSPVAAFELAKLFFEKLNYSITGSAFHKKVNLADGDDVELIEVELDELKKALISGDATDFRIYSEVGHNEPWLCSFGYTTESFGNFFCIDAQSEETFESSKDKFTDYIDKIILYLKFTYAIIYNAEKVSDAMWYARGENLKTLFPFECPVAFSEDTPGLYEGERTYEKTKLRMVYPVNYLNDNHLSIVVEGIPLPEWIAINPERGILKKVSGKSCWIVPESSLFDVNKYCGESGALLAWRPAQKKNKKLP